MSSNKEYTIINSPELESRKIVCLTLDVEQDYGELLDEPSYEGLEHIPELVSFFKERNIPLTCFVQGSLFETHPAQIEELMTLDAEFELHSYSHPRPGKTDFEFEVKKGTEAYRRFFAKDPLGYRAPLGYFNGKTDYEVLVSNGFKFDSSMWPFLRPGVFNNLRKPTKPYFVNDSRIIEFPAPVFSSVIRIPIALSYIKLLSKPYLYLLRTSLFPRLIIFNFHLHDLFELSSSKKIPFEKCSIMYSKIFRRIYYEGQLNGLKLLDEFMSLCHKRQYEFLKLVNVYEATSNLEAKNDKAMASQRI
ncbi:polysaccharide deacetylase family protein [Chloroflexota bacterium]